MARKQADDEAAVLQKISELEPFTEVAARLHDIIMTSAPGLAPRLWYGMPGYAKVKSSPVIIFFRVDGDYVTLGLTEKADLTPDDDAADHLLESAWFLTELDAATESRIAHIVSKAAR